MSTLFLFGAGASAFSRDCLPCPPPLGNQLFHELARMYEVAKDIDSDLAMLFKADFEAGMAEFLERHDVKTAAFIRAMGSYFARFEPGPTNLYIDLLRRMIETKRRFVCATLNYDLLIELSGGELGWRTSYATTDVPPKNLSILKIHGSCNFLPDVPPNSIRKVGFRGFVGACDAVAWDGKLRVGSPAEVIKFCRTETSLAPALALYARGKPMLFARSVIARQQEEYANAVAKAARIYVVGVRVHAADRHVWEPLGRSSGPIFYVGPDTSELFAWADANHRKHVSHLAASFEAAIPQIVRHHHR